MAGESDGDGLFYDFIIDEPEMPTPTPMSMPTQTPANLAAASTGPPQPQTITQTTTDFDAANIASGRPPHLAHLQQPISAPNRTSPQPQRHLPTSSDPLNPAMIPVASAVASAVPDPTQPVNLSSRDQSRPLPPSHHAAMLDLHGHHPQSTAPMAAVTFQTHISPILNTLCAPMSMDWSMYGVAQSPMPLHTSPFDFELPGSAMMPSMPHHGHMSPGISDHNLGYGAGVVSPSSIRSSQSHYGFSGSWEDHMGHDGNTPTVSTPVGQASTNPWTDPEELQRELDSVHGSRPKKTPRSRKSKRDARNSTDSRNGPSPDAASPSSTSQNSRASISSKTASVASSSVASSSVASSSTTSSRYSKLRSASRTSKNSHSKPNDTPEDRRTRASHNLVEKQYRNRLNAQFESLLSVLPEQIRASGEGDDNSDGGGDWGDRRVSKGEVLEMARRHIKSLEQERDILERENSGLQGSLAQYKKTVGADEEGAGQESPLNFNISMDDDQDEDPS